MECLVTVELSWENRCRATSTEMGLLRPQWGHQSHLHQEAFLASFHLQQQEQQLHCLGFSSDTFSSVVYTSWALQAWWCRMRGDNWGWFVVWCGLLLVKGWEWTSCFWERGRMRWGGDVKGNILWRDLHKILIRSFWHMRSDHLLRLKITVLCCQLPEFLQSRLGRISVQQTIHRYMA